MSAKKLAEHFSELEDPCLRAHSVVLQFLIHLNNLLGVPSNQRSGALLSGSGRPCRFGDNRIWVRRSANFPKNGVICK
jgi:hypothetical protein